MKDYFGKPIKKLGFGLMRLPFFGKDERSQLDMEAVTQMADLFLESGYSYFDSAYTYHGGQSEVAFRTAVSSRYARDAFQIATKLPLWRPLSAAEMRAITDESLERCGVDYFDLYLLHSVGPDRIPMLEQMGAFDYLQGLKADGLARNVGFSYHGSPEGLSRILDAHGSDQIDLVQLQINYLDWDNPDVQARLCYEAATSRGVGVVIMEPIKGGSLANFPPEAAEILQAVDPEASLASWALRFALDLPEAAVVLSGMTTIDQVRDNIAVAEGSKPLSAADHEVLQQVIAALEKIATIPCTDCGYCLDDCPEQIPINRIIAILNDYTRYQNLLGSRRQFNFAVGGGFAGDGPQSGRPSDCQECGVCEDHCPQGIDIIEANKQAAAIFE